LSERAAEKAQSMREQGALPGGYVPARDFPILFEDDSFLAIDKPAGVAVHGGSGVSFGVIEQLRMARPQARFLELVHRLDRETSGILLVAKKRSALKNLQDQFRERETGKTYLALVSGHWPANKKVLDKPLLKYLLPAAQPGGAEERRVKVASRDQEGAMSALTLVRVRATNTPVPGAAAVARPYSLLEVTIKTGRTHQIRVHLAAEGMPIVGDDKYGNFDLNRELARASGPGGLKRMFLHAWSFQCNHPVTGERIALQAKLPADLSAFLVSAMPSASN
jgi:23S rRNA pseudouridine955/2504/2580 synthase